MFFENILVSSPVRTIWVFDISEDQLTPIMIVNFLNNILRDRFQCVDVYLLFG